jgi:isopenicillin-N N-acyltransferase like protein
MHGGELRVLEIYGGPGDLGTAHGEVCASMIRKYLADRLGLATEERWSGGGVDREFILTTAEATLGAHERYSPGLFQEMIAMAGAAGITPAEAVVVGGFTDLVDVLRSTTGSAPNEDDCTAVINPRGGYLAQTWDMHASAGEYVVLLKLDPLAGPNVIVQTTAGCLGQMGMNEAGIAVGINNLTSMGRIGVTWPFVVRKVLEQTSIDAAIEAVLEAELAGGHNFLVMGPDGEGANIEAMPGHHEVTRVTDDPYVHSNHCLFPTTSSEEGARLEESIVSSDLRLKLGTELADDLDSFFADPAISRRPTTPEEIATCGAVIMEPAARRMRAVWGVPGDHPWETFSL